MPIHFQRTIPVLRIFDLEKAKQFYSGFLGFRIDWEHRFDDTSPVYMQVSRDGLTLHLTEHHGDACPGSTVFIWMSGIDEFHAEISSKGYPYMRPGLETTAQGAQCVDTMDPFGNRLRFHGSPDMATPVS
jgi:catechol 2,3-dioxygenase-like lactoylglutathione lyase family enzyme